MFEYQGVKIYWLKHAGFRVEFDDKNLYFDPYDLVKSYPSADYILITHEHFDHCDSKSISKLVKSGTTIIVPEIAKSCVVEFSNKCIIKTVKPGDVLELPDIKVHVFPSYNLTKFRAPGKVYHPKEDNRVGYVVEVKSIKIYHAGDTDVIPEMDDVGKLGIDIALLPVSGTYVMTAEEAFEAVKKIKPKIAIPMHYGLFVGTKSDAEKFKVLCEKEGFKVVVLSPSE